VRSGGSCGGECSADSDGLACLVRPAPTVEASVGETRSTAPRELPAERLAGAVEPHTGITWSNTCLLRVAADTGPVEIYPSDCRSIFRLEGLEEVQNAGADHRLELAIGSLSTLGFGGVPVDCPIA
jgi:hypothetical protein